MRISPARVKQAFRAFGAALSGLRCNNRPYIFLDIGARRGVAASYRVLERSGIFDVVMVEADEDEAEHLRAAFPGSTVIHAALGSADGETAELRKTFDPDMSSLLEPLPLKGSTGESLKVLDRVPITISKLESIWPLGDRFPHFAKLDVQGYELEVLKGMKSMLSGVIGLEVELRIERHYYDQPLLPDIYDFLQSEDLDMVRLHPNGFKDCSRMVVFNGYFINRRHSRSPRHVSGKTSTILEAHSA